MDKNQERQNINLNNSVELLQQSKTETIEANQKSTVESSPRDMETRAEKAKNEALETVVSIESENNEKYKQIKHSSPVIKTSICKKQKEASYMQIMSHVQNELNPGNRIFSKLIHNKMIEKTSDVIGNTIARPNALLLGSFFAFIFSLLAYTVSKKIGYSMSGFETIASFIFGWSMGIIFDYLKVLFTGKK